MGTENGVAESEQLVAIDLVTVLPGATGFKEAAYGNINDTFRGEVLTRTGDTRYAVIKDLFPKELANELLIAVIGRALGLAIVGFHAELSRLGA